MTSAVEAPISLIALNNRKVVREVDDYLYRYKKAITKIILFSNEILKEIDRTNGQTKTASAHYLCSLICHARFYGPYGKR
jgi:hypothetical protein